MRPVSTTAALLLRACAAAALAAGGMLVLRRQGGSGQRKTWRVAGAALALMMSAQTGTSRAATIIAPDPFDGVAGTFALRFDVAGAMPSNEVISEAYFTAVFRALALPSPAPLLDVTEIPRRLVERRPVGDGAYTTYRTETISRYGVRPAKLAIAVGDLQEAERVGRVGRIELATTPVATSITNTRHHAYLLGNSGVDFGNCEEDNPHWTQFIFKGPPDDCYATHIDTHQTVITTIIETPDTIGVPFEVSLTEADIAFAELNGFIEMSFTGNGGGEVHAPQLVLKTVARAIDSDGGDIPVAVPVPPSVTLLAAALAILVRRAKPGRSPD